MSYFLKSSKTKKGIYFQVYDGVYDKLKGHAIQKPIKVIGYYDDLLKQGISDPKAYAISVVNKLKDEKKEKEAILISNDSDLFNAGYLFLDSFLKKLNIETELNLFNFKRKVQYKLFDALRFLVFAQIINPSSKLHEYKNISLLEKFNLTYSQLLDAISVLGNDYDSIINLINDKMQKLYKRKTSNVYFDCTNYYFEIDKPIDDKQKGPSKENRTDPIIGMALLLDKDQIPLSMKMYPGNQSEKSKIRELINDMKESGCIIGKTIQVADKGLNCGQNIFEAIKNNDGYIYSQSIKQLPEIDKQGFVLNEYGYKNIAQDGLVVFKSKSSIDHFEYKFEYNGQTYVKSFKQKRVVYYSKALYDKQILELDNLVNKACKLYKSQAKRSEYGECGKYINFGVKNKYGDISYSEVKAFLNIEKISQDKKLCGYNMLITSEIDMTDEEVYSVYHNLWKIEESFRILKTDLIARPVYLQKKESIYGHFLICYISLLILRYLEIKKFKEQVNVQTLIRFMREYQLFKSDNGYINCCRIQDVPQELVNETKLPLLKKYINAKDLKKLISYKL